MVAAFAIVKLFPFPFLALSLAAVLWSGTGTDGAHFSVSGKDGQVCILLDATFEITLEAIRHKKVVERATVSSELLDLIHVSGMCGDSLSTMHLQFPDKIRWSLIFKNTDDSKLVTLNKLVQFRPDEIFPELTKLDNSLTYDGLGITDLSFSNQSYQCDKTTRTTYFFNNTIADNITFSVRGDMFDFKVQAFGVQNGTYSPAKICQDDKTTPTSPTKPTTTTATPVTHRPTGPPTYYVKDLTNDVTCIVMRANLAVHIRYLARNKAGGNETKTAKFSVPRDAIFTGNCQLTAAAQSLYVTFFESWKLAFIFEKKEKPTDNEQFLAWEDPDKIDFRVHNISLTYSVDQQHFPGSVLPEGQTVQESAEKGIIGLPHKPTGSRFYSCDAVVDLKLNDRLTLVTSDLDLKAFNDDNKRDFYGYASECLTDGDNFNYAVLIGAISGGIWACVILAVITITVCRKRKSASSYNTL